MTTYYARSFKDLRVYQKAREVSRSAFGVTRGFPRDEKYSLTDQMLRAARAIGAQVAEAWGKRRYEKHFVSKLTDADAEQMETQHWVDEALACGYLAPAEAVRLNGCLQEIGRMLNSMMEKSDAFCGPIETTLHESATEYFTNQEQPDDNRLFTDH